MNPALDIANYLENQGIGTVGANIFVSPVRPVSQYVPVNSIFVLETGGYPPQRVHSNRSELRYPSIQIIVRWNDFANGYTKAQAIYDVLRAPHIPGYWDVLPDQSGSIYLGQDENSNYLWSLNFTAKY